MTAPKYSKDIAEVRDGIRDLVAGQQATNTNLTGLNTKVDTLIAHDYDHEGRLSKVEDRTSNGRFTTGEKMVGYGGGTGVVGLIAYAILQQLGWLPVGG
ncbi:hypothetical protein LCGC14_0386180 [marine sediment metagenome]|uniref:Uncharacterized protein n=1 Tax=marine sediment metagenome TaxID=412755 RepID=A0A0F9T6Q1_9ZZZZ